MGSGLPIGPNTPHSAYCSAKFAVKGFSEALVTDLRMNAPHVGVSVVMPGHIGTSIAINSGKVLGRPDAIDMSEEDIKDYTREDDELRRRDVRNSDESV